MGWWKKLAKDKKYQSKDKIDMQDIRLIAGEGKLTDKTIQQAIKVIRKQRGN